MASVALCLCFGKFERGVAVLARNHLVLAYKREFGAFMIKVHGLEIHFPSIGFMAIVTIGSETITMRRFLG
jgi:hypothetical protein